MKQSSSLRSNRTPDTTLYASPCPFQHRGLRRGAVRAPCGYKRSEYMSMRAMNGGSGRRRNERRDSGRRDGGTTGGLTTTERRSSVGGVTECRSSGRSVTEPRSSARDVGCRSSNRSVTECKGSEESITDLRSSFRSGHTRRTSNTVRITIPGESRETRDESVDLCEQSSLVNPDDQACAVDRMNEV
jgi:hypothetical protein